MKKRLRLSKEKCDFLGLKYEGKANDNRHKRKTLNQDQLNKLKKFNLSKIKKQNRAKILILDIETSPLNNYTWGLWKQNVQTKQIIQDWYMLSWSAKWLFSEDVLNDGVTPDEVKNQDDKRICKSIKKLMDQADIIIAHNGDKFDFRKLNARFIINKLGRPSSFMSIDTLKHARKHLAISSNKLDYLAKVFGFDGKMETGGFELWDSCMKGCPDAMEKMIKYCDQDVRVLEDVYLEMLPWIKPHPNLSIFSDDDLHRCPTCSSDNLSYSSTYITTMNEFDEFKCKDCGSHCRSKKSNKISKKIMSSLPK